MKDCKFKQLVLDVYKEWQKPQRIFTKGEFGIKTTYNNFWGIIYGAIATESFMDIKDINKYMELCNPDMLLLHSRITKQEIEIYEYNIKDYKIVDDELILEFKNGVVVFNL